LNSGRDSGFKSFNSFKLVDFFVDINDGALVVVTLLRSRSGQRCTMFTRISAGALGFLRIVCQFSVSRFSSHCYRTHDCQQRVGQFN
jgi:hypothetical protein